MTEQIAGKTSAELRAAFIARRLVPTAAIAFKACPEAHSVVYAVAQFWADEASDAVHELMVPSADPNPTWPECLRALPFHDGEGGAVQKFKALWKDAGIGPYGFDAPKDAPYFDENGLGITAFASYCLEDCDQEMAFEEAYAPYAIARRDPQAETGVTVEIIGELIRPEWEDRFDVGSGDD